MSSPNHLDSSHKVRGSGHRVKPSLPTPPSNPVGGADAQDIRNEQRGKQHFSRGNYKNQGDRGRNSRSSQAMPRRENSGADFNKNRREREHPMGLKDLQLLAQGDDPAPIFAVINEKSGFPLALHDERLKDNPERMKYVLKVLRRAMEMHGFGHTVGRAISLAVHSNLLDSLIQFNLTTLPPMCDSKPGDARDIVRSEISLFDLIVRLCPADEAMNVEACANSIRMVLLDMDEILGPDVELNQTYKRVRENLADLRKTVEKPDHVIAQKVVVHGRSHLEEAPENFRTLSVLPTLADLLSKEKPFLRANITNGRYLNTDHYLDVQFRLMKEDFVRPLRDGVVEIMKGMEKAGDNFAAWRKIQDVRIYEKGVVVGKVYERVGITLELKFSLKNLGRVRWEISKRLIFGSLLCLTNDGFQSVLFASVADRKVEDLKRGVVRIRPESAQFDLNAWTKGPEFLIVESAAFFEAYRHVLHSLQNIPLERYPLKEHIVDLERNMFLPQYMEDYRGQEAGIFLLTGEGRQLYGNPFTDQWPKPEELGLDEAQFRAFKAGLSHKFALIQGPPGTGKTFIGLKLVQTILTRRHEFKIVNDGPILVVCFTNHALDQFLEGISKFTKKILRIGGRSKSTLLEEFTVRNAQMKYRGNAFQVSRDIRMELLTLERALGELEILRKGISSGAGILSVNALRQYGIEIPESFGPDFSLATWLGFNNSANSSENFLKQILDEEKGLLFAEKRMVKLPDENQDDEEIGTENNEIDAVDLDIEDEAAAEAQRREMESIYDTDRAAAVPTTKQTSECIRRHCEISSLSLEEAVMKAEAEVNKISEMMQDLVGDPDIEVYVKQRDHGTLLRELMQAEYKLETSKMKKNKLEADSAFLKVPSSLDLVKPPERLVGPEENWMSSRVKGKWLIYRYWANQLVRIICNKIDAEMEKYKLLVERYKEAQDGALLQHTRSLDVVGMTTTGAARNMSLVQNMRAKILVVEEAAEVLESHIVCCLSTHCEQLIQIGDQQQLRPTTTVYKLAKDYGLDVSMFERMVKNNIPYERLRQQHRMRPEISNLIKVNVYEDLQDYRTVELYDDILGVDKNVFFVTHNVPESSNEDLKSKSNEVEVEFLLGLCRYLLLQGYKPSQITILTGYSGQLFVFKKAIDRFPMCREVRITLVDNYQGEENDIILLSLVRSNLDGNIGFLRTDNRVNVALSRAKQGLFIVGNMDILSAGSGLWMKIKNVLEKDKQIGRALILRCQIHPDQVASVFKPSDFPISGGCTRICNGIINACGHLCERLCHVIDKEHKTGETRCRRPCERKCDALERHACKSICGKPCPPCNEKVERMLVPCKHLREMKCCENVAQVKCLVKCIVRLDCGHACEKSCHVKEDPDHLYTRCTKECGKSCPREHPCKGLCWQDPCPPCQELVNLTLLCGHSIKALCNVKPDQVECKKECKKQLPCGHPCRKKCKETCGDCREMVEKINPGCSHSVRVLCSKAPENADCKKDCERLLPCGHKCQKKCSDRCTTSCSVMLNMGKVGKCGHLVRLPCHIVTSRKILSSEEEMEFCDHPCGATLSCEHKCVGKCSECLQGRIHVPCREPCGRQLVCGHVCKVACSANCPPCREQCENFCPHSVCKKLCGEPCASCLEKCKSGCRHKPCKLRCSDDCGRGSDKCNEPCEKVLGCKHKCVGLCGEICPPCRECSKNTVEFFDVIMNDICDEPDARFVVLKCKHIIEVDGMDQWMQMPMEAIGLRLCPRCKTPIVSSHRYREEVRASLRAVNDVKKRIFGENHDLQRILEKMLDPSESSACGMIKTVFLQEQFIDQIFNEIGYRRLNHPKEKKASNRTLNKLNGMECNSITNRLDLLEALAAMISKYNREESLTLNVRSQLEAKLRKLAQLVMSRKNNLDGSVLQSFSSEIQRLRYVPLLEMMRAKVVAPQGKNLIAKVEAILADIGCFTAAKETEVKALLEEAKKYCSTLVVTPEEKRMILQAMGLKKGHWYKCPNGHVYCITECGGAMEQSRCPDCGESIGGGSHALLRSNRVATEMDGSLHPAWSDAYNNMANFNFDDVRRLKIVGRRFDVFMLRDLGFSKVQHRVQAEDIRQDLSQGRAWEAHSERRSDSWVFEVTQVEEDFLLELIIFPIMVYPLPNVDDDHRVLQTLHVSLADEEHMLVTFFEGIEGGMVIEEIPEIKIIRVVDHGCLIDSPRKKIPVEILM
ncbi:unnamed protein product [Notodromas monacha]|uniref:RZ-type domain-containing protein n=1 Tax=Notodromas monacha TaxID=399045 RepID=A0A7R9BJN2_9CRUS|nr:unnamed protein product [Notodromas monacha]CAG0916689.1 unnamed protein product [Notodromas monacha]